jgi:hypothetical protein
VLLKLDAIGKVKNQNQQDVLLLPLKTLAQIKNVSGILQMKDARELSPVICLKIQRFAKKVENADGLHLQNNVETFQKQINSQMSGISSRQTWIFQKLQLRFQQKTSRDSLSKIHSALKPTWTN